MSTLRETLDAHERLNRGCSCGWSLTRESTGLGDDGWREHREAAVRAALAQDAPIDEAWHAVEAVLPEGWHLSELLAPLYGCAFPGSWAALAIPDDPDGPPTVIGRGDTAQAALLALRDALLERQT